MHVIYNIGRNMNKDISQRKECLMLLKICFLIPFQLKMAIQKITSNLGMFENITKARTINHNNESCPLLDPPREEAFIMRGAGP